MAKLVVLKLEGDFEQGFRVWLEIGEQSERPRVEIRAALPSAPDVSAQYELWQLSYRRLESPVRIKPKPGQVTNVSFTKLSQNCHKQAQRFRQNLNSWLNSELFRPVRETLLERLMPTDEVQVIIQTENYQLRRLPWHLWDFFERYQEAEIALSALEYSLPTQSQIAPSKTPVRILAILGDSRGIDISKDRALLEQLPDAETTFLVEPQRKILNEQLWEQPWDILFFAGHSATQKGGESGLLYINQTESLTITELEKALKKAITKGLKLAIFNSCDGLGLAHQLEGLNIPQMIVMREPVPDVVAQEFFNYFLTAFSAGKSLYLAVREAREKLQGLEDQFPCATWLPVICQNPAEVPMTWPKLPPPSRQIRPNLHKLLLTILLSSVVSTAGILGVRHLGLIQRIELQAYDQLMQLRPAEPPDKRLLVITVDEQDIEYQDRMGMKRQGSLSDQALAQVLEKLRPFNPRVIGLDIYRDFPVAPAYANLTTYLKKDPRFFAICKMSAPEDGDANGVQPPPEVPTERLGFSDFVVDPDGILRRHLLAMAPDTAGCTTHYALSVQLALRYLETQGISLQFTPDGDLQLGSVVFKRLQPHTGGYQNVDASGHQVLLNYRYRYYRSLVDIAPKVSLTQVLTGQINSNLVKERIVLIGVTTAKTQDYWFTPYSAGHSRDQQLLGVLAQAQMVSHILSAVLDGRPLLWVWTRWGEALWIWSWSLLGGVLGWRCRSLLQLGLANVISFGVLYGVCFGFMTQGGWIPLVPAAIAVVATSGGVAAYLSYLTQRQTVNIRQL